MNRAIFFAMLAGGIVLLVFGTGALNSTSSDISQFFTGAPTDKAIWMLVGGAIVSAVGLMGLLSGSSKGS